ncbi:MAG: efflux RND transporter periplasmic adaptor subunit [Acidobacteria bacterium]|nr:efflux RND transporter periplasmic adaptor subunit [Acidobacteriota bacterium]
MNGSRARLPWPLLGLIAVGLLAAGAAIGYGIRRPADPPAGAATGMPAESATPPADAGHVHSAVAPASDTPTTGDVVVTLTPAMASRAGITTAAATTGVTSAELRMPGIVQPNAYKEVAVTSLVSGRVTQVNAELGERVTAQQPLATVYSPELAEAQTAFIAARAEQAAHAQKQARTQRLTAIGAATREELEAHEAERAKIDADVEIARARLALFGIPEERTQRLAGPQDVVTTIAVRAPLAGVVTRRAANAGLNIDPSMPLFTVTDLSTVWVVADLYERDFSKVRVGSPAAVTSTAYPGMTLRGRVSYIDPQVQQETRTAKLRVEVPNPSGQLRFGMYVDVQAGQTGARPGLFVPKTAVQLVGGGAVVYLAQGDGRFVERKVTLGGENGDRVLVASGLQPGDQVVTSGVFFLRAERERTVGGGQ